MAKRTINPTVSEEFSKRKMRHDFAFALTTPAFILLLFSDEVGALTGISISALRLVVWTICGALIAFFLFDWRCPSCKKWLGRKQSPRSCPKCGVQLQA